MAGRGLDLTQVVLAEGLNLGGFDGLLFLRQGRGGEEGNLATNPVVKDHLGHSGGIGLSSLLVCAH